MSFLCLWFPLGSPVSSMLPKTWIGYLQWTNILFRVCFYFKPSVPGTGPGSMVALTRIKQIIKMSE